MHVLNLVNGAALYGLERYHVQLFLIGMLVGDYTIRFSMSVCVSSIYYIVLLSDMRGSTQSYTRPVSGCGTPAAPMDILKFLNSNHDPRARSFGRPLSI